MLKQTYHDRLCKLFGFSKYSSNPNGLVLLLYTTTPCGTSYVLKSWGSKVPYTVIQADTLCQMEYPPALHTLSTPSWARPARD